MKLTRGAAVAGLIAALAVATVVPAAAVTGSTYTQNTRTFDVACASGVGTVTADLGCSETAADGPHSYSINTSPRRTETFATEPGTHSDHVVFGNLAPANYTLSFTDPDGITQTALAPVCGTAVNLSGSTSRAAYGQLVTLTADVFTLQSPHRHVGGATLRVYRALLGHPSVFVGTTTTGADGTARYAFTATASACWSMRYAGSTQLTGNASNGHPIGVRQTVGVAPSTQMVRAGRTGQVYGAVNPSSAGGYVYVQYEDGVGVWRSLNRAELKYQLLPNGQATVGYVIRFIPDPGARAYRTLRPNTTNLAGATSRPVYVDRA